MANLKKGDTYELIYKTEIESWMQKTNQGIRGGEGINGR